MYKIYGKACNVSLQQWAVADDVVARREISSLSEALHPIQTGSTYNRLDQIGVKIFRR